MVTNPVEGSRLMTSDGVELATRSWSCDGEPRAIVVLVHGLSSTKDHPHVVGLAERLRARSLDVLSYDARGHGESEGLCTLGDSERNDVPSLLGPWRREWQVRCPSPSSMGATTTSSPFAFPWVCPTLKYPMPTRSLSPGWVTPSIQPATGRFAMRWSGSSTRGPVR
jgi:pimeloyl-ACP methyl ester carboxylesterase